MEYPKCCIPTIKISTINASDTAFQLVPSEPLYAAQLENLQRLNLIICTKLPQVTQLAPIVIYTTDAGNINLNCKYGNYMYRDQICSRRRYPIIFGNNPNHFQMLEKINSTCGACG